MNWTETVVSICTGIITLTQFLLWRYIARNKSYESEKGKNLATKEDVAEITKKIESVKESYSKALENHKIELQKEFESHKHIVKLCNNIDNKLLYKLVTCKNTIADALNDYVDLGKIDDSSINSIRQLSGYLQSYNTRYGNNECVKRVIAQSGDLTRIYVNNSTACGFNNSQYFEKIQDIDKNIDLILNHFLPKLNI